MKVIFYGVFLVLYKDFFLFRGNNDVIIFFFLLLDRKWMVKSKSRGEVMRVSLSWFVKFFIIGL